MLNLNNVGKCSEGYMGAVKWEGSNSHKFLYGAELSKAIREELKASGIKGVSVRVHTFSGGQEITATIKTTAADYVDYDEFAKYVEVSDVISGWIKDLDGSDMFYEEFYALDKEKQDAVLEYNTKLLYDRMIDDRQMMQYDLECSHAAKSELVGKLYVVNAVIKSFNYDDSNGMVDYFDTNFYYDIEFKRIDK